MTEQNNLREVAADDDSTPESKPPPTQSERSAVRERLRNRQKRMILMVVVPALVVTAAVYAYLHAGRHVVTDNAYVQGHIVNITAEVSGVINRVGAEEYQHVNAGDELLRIEDRTYRIAVDRADATLAEIRSEIEADKLAYRGALTEIAMYETSLRFAQAQFARQVGLRDANLGTLQDLDTAKYNLDTAQQQIEVAQQKAASLLARLNGNADIPVADHPRYREADAALAQAALDLEHTIVAAPADGVVINRPEPGDYVEPGKPMMALVADRNLWIEANFKETQLTHVREGQQAEIRIDTYPGSIWHGRVESISEATGAQFALLPPQNATGNWVKIVQRIPVRIAIEQTQELPALRLGMSSTISIDTGYVRSWRDLVPGQ
jgi:membrane fusion protein, multidrug efflux system